MGKAKKIGIGIIIGLFGIIVAAVGYSAYNFATLQTNAALDAPPSAGTLGDDHVHASILVRIFGDKFNFSLPAYQIKSSWIHFEGQDGDTIHRHSTGMQLGYLFETLGIILNDECYIFPDGREFCTNEDYSLKFYINHKQVPSITNYVINEDDRILISYGNETPEQIEKQLVELDSQQILEERELTTKNIEMGSIPISEKFPATIVEQKQQADPFLDAKKELNNYLQSLEKATLDCNGLPDSVKISPLEKKVVDETVVNSVLMILVIEEAPIDSGLLPYKQKIITGVDRLTECLNRH